MAEAALSSKNQIVVSKDAREALGIGAGDKLLIVVRENCLLVMLFRKGASRGGARRLPQELPEKGARELGLESLSEFLARHRRIALDTSIFI